MLWACLSTVVRPAVKSDNKCSECRSSGCKRRGAATLWSESGVPTRDDNQWPTILTQITFDVMSVRNPILSTSALTRRVSSIIFNLDYDRFIFRDETVNLVSHECHSYLRVTVANGVPHRKAMTMIEGNVSVDVDEEELQLETRERSPMQIKQNHKLRELRKLRRVPRGCCTTRPTYHIEIGAPSASQVAQEVLRTDES